MNFGMQFAEALKVARQTVGLSQEQLAEKTGMSRASIANYETGLQGISLEHAVLLASVLNFSLDAFKASERQKLIEAQLEEVSPMLRDAILKTLK